MELQFKPINELKSSELDLNNLKSVMLIIKFDGNDYIGYELAEIGFEQDVFLDKEKKICYGEPRSFNLFLYDFDYDGSVRIEFFEEDGWQLNNEEIRNNSLATSSFEGCEVLAYAFLEDASMALEGIAK